MDNTTGSWASSEAVRRSMLGNRRRDTSPELALRRELRALGLTGYRVDSPLAYGRADLAFVGRRVAVFVDGCYWHGCPDHFRPPKTNVEFWTEKIDRNRQRDRGVDEVLRLRDWTVVRVWEHEDPADAAAKVAEIVRAAKVVRHRRGITPHAQPRPAARRRASPRRA